MHYYKFNIADWSLATSHLSLPEEAVYFRLLNHYYDTEEPIPLDMGALLRRLRLSESENLVLHMLREFFAETTKGWIHTRCEKEIKEYRKTCAKNKKNGGNGGRPRKIKEIQETQSEPTGIPLGTQSEPTGNPNHKPLTINQEPLTNNHKPKVYTSVDVQAAFDYWRQVMGKDDSTKLTPKRHKAIYGILKQGYRLDQIKLAIDGCKRSAWHMGNNDRHTVYNDIELICRDGGKLEYFIASVGQGAGVETIDQTQSRIETQAERVAQWYQENLQ